MRTATGRLGVLFSVFLVLLAFLAPGCSGGGPSVNPDEIVAGAAAALAGLETYRMDSHVSGTMAGDSAGRKTTLIGFFDTNAAVDATHHRMQLDMTMGMGQDAASSGLKYYGQAFLIENHLYTGISRTPAGFQWTKGDLAANYWASAEVMKQQVDLLQSAGRSLAGQEAVDGVDCYVFDLTPDFAGTIAALNLEAFLGSQLPDWKEEWLQSAAVRQWISKDASRLVKSETQLTLRMPAAEVDPSMGQGDVDVSVSGQAHFHNYNEWVSITVPPEAIQ